MFLKWENDGVQVRPAASGQTRDACAEGGFEEWRPRESWLALSSAEADLCVASKVAAEALGAQSIARDLSDYVRIVFRMGASAATGILGRSGFGRLRHVQTKEKLLQHELREGRLGLKKTLGRSECRTTLNKRIGRKEPEKHKRSKSGGQRPKRSIDAFLYSRGRRGHAYRRAVSGEASGSTVLVLYGRHQVGQHAT